MRKWDTLFQLKQDHSVLGLEGMVFFLVDFPLNVETGEMNYVIAQPTFNGLGVGPGIASFVLTKEKVEKFFQVIDKTLKQYEQELEENFFSEK